MFLKKNKKIFLIQTVDRMPDPCYNITIKKGRYERMYESDKVIGASHREAIQWITAMDLWDEVIDLEVDCYGIVTAVIH